MSGLSRSVARVRDDDNSGDTNSGDTIPNSQPAYQIDNRRNNDDYAWNGGYDVSRNYTVNRLNQYTAADGMRGSVSTLLTTTARRISARFSGRKC